MKRILPNIALAWTAALFACLAGCQNRLVVTVEMIQTKDGLPIDDNERIHEGKAAEAVQASIRALGLCRDFPDALLGYLVEKGHLAQANADNATMGIASTVKAMNEEIDAKQRKGVELYAKILSTPPDDVDNLWPEIDAYRVEVTNFIKDKKQTASVIVAATTALVEANKKDAVTKAAEAYADHKFESYVAASKSSGAVVSGFGGFTTPGVYKISPGDKNFDKVLSGKPVGEPITQVLSEASGDSTIIFVQEVPAQLRVFSIDLDPSMLIQNVLYITNKALQAAAKYATPM